MNWNAHEFVWQDWTILAVGFVLIVWYVWRTLKKDKEKLYRATERISIVHQMENLLTFPEVERKVKNGELQIHGWYYRIEDGTIEYYDGEECSFKPLQEK